MIDESLITPWFPRTTQPARNGVYQRKFVSNVFYAKWKNGIWFCAWLTTYEAELETAISPIQTAFAWRGIYQTENA